MKQYWAIILEYYTDVIHIYNIILYTDVIDLSGVVSSRVISSIK